MRAAGAEAIIACPHWGVEYAAAPSDEQRHWAQVLADAGADLIIGGHPHVVQPFEVIQSSEGREVPVFWSVGNFVSTQTRKDSMVGAMAQASLLFDGDDCQVASCTLTPVITHRAEGTAFTTYRISDYTEELAAANLVRGFSGAGTSRTSGAWTSAPSAWGTPLTPRPVASSGRHDKGVPSRETPSEESRMGFTVRIAPTPASPITRSRACTRVRAAGATRSPTRT